MANEVIDNLTPDYVVGNERQRKQINANVTPVTLLATQLVKIADFTDRVAVAIAVSSGVVVKVNAAGTISAISAGQDLNGSWIGYQSAAGDTAGDAIVATLEYWDQI